ncbi:MAG: PDZ domain-containing protein [Planctomycetes bacterium]|nr:PDZ domain-containing protein [Planctomycetota bacterium]
MAKHSVFVSSFLFVAACASPRDADVRSERAVTRAAEPGVLATPAPPSREDPAVLRREITQRYHARLDELMARARLDLRLTLDEVVPVPYLGVDSDPIDGGLRLNAVYPDTAAERAGLAIGDVLERFDGRVLDAKASLARAVRARSVGDAVELVFTRGGERRTLTVELGPRPEEDEDELEQFPDLVATPSVPAPVRFDFEDSEAERPPKGLFAKRGGHGEAPAWRVIRGDSGQVLRQASADATGIRFPQALVSDWRAADVVARVRFRYHAGRVDRAAGIILRWQSPHDYLVARVNAAEHDVRIFRVVHGDRRTLPGAVAQVATDDGEWHTLEFRAEGARLTAIVDGRVETSAFDTFFDRGAIGLWTKSDAVTDFDDFVAEANR